MSRILSGAQEPKLGVAWSLAKVLGVSLDYLLESDGDLSPETRTEIVTSDEAALLRVVRRLGAEAALDRLISPPGPPARPGRSRVRR